MIQNCLSELTDLASWPILSSKISSSSSQDLSLETLEPRIFRSVTGLGQEVPEFIKASGVSYFLRGLSLGGTFRGASPMVNSTFDSNALFHLKETQL